MTSYQTYLSANFHKTYWPCVWKFFFVALGLVVLVAVGFAASELMTAETPSFDVIDFVILFGLVAAAIPSLFFISLLSAAAIAASFLWSRWRRGGRDENLGENLDSADGSGDPMTLP
jgi:hypothetical protein